MAPAIFNAIVTPVIKWPWRLVRLPVRLVLVVAGVRKRRAYNLPVAGLDQAKAQGIMFALRRAATNPEVQQSGRTILGLQRALAARNSSATTVLERPKGPRPPTCCPPGSQLLQEERIAGDWLAAWQLSQVASNRLLHELDEVQANLEFWTRRVQRGNHFWFLLLQQVRPCCASAWPGGSRFWKETVACVYLVQLLLPRQALCAPVKRKQALDPARTILCV